MTISDVERKIRSSLVFTRFLTAYMPISFAQWVIRKSASRAKLPANMALESVSTDSVPAYWLIPQNSPQNKVLLYLHGGGFVYGVTSVHLEMVGYMSEKMGIRVLMVDYRLAPQHPFPAALDDCVAAYRWLLKQGFSAENIVIAGDSAGGNLTITTLMQLRSSGDPLPSAAACLSPVADLTGREAGLQDDYDLVLHPRASKFFLQSFVAGNDAQNPLISPVFGDWHGLPPMLIHAGGDEILRDDAVQIEALAKAARVDVQLDIYPRMWHVWQIYLSLPQAIQSLSEIAQFLKLHLADPTIATS